MSCHIFHTYFCFVCEIMFLFQHWFISKHFAHLYQRPITVECCLHRSALSSLRKKRKNNEHVKWKETGLITSKEKLWKTCRTSDHDSDLRPYIQYYSTEDIKKLGITQDLGTVLQYFQFFLCILWHLCYTLFVWVFAKPADSQLLTFQQHPGIPFKVS